MLRLRNNKEFPNKNRKIWRKFLIDSGYSIPQITKAIRSIREEDWETLETSKKISLIKKHLKSAKEPKMTY